MYTAETIIQAPPEPQCVQYPMPELERSTDTFRRRKYRGLVNLLNEIEEIQNDMYEATESLKNRVNNLLAAEELEDLLV
jgi:hypothetical protein